MGACLQAMVFEEEKTRVSAEKPLGPRTRTDNKLNQDMKKVHIDRYSNINKTKYFPPKQMFLFGGGGGGGTVLLLLFL